MPSTSDTTRRPWNLGRLIGPKPPFKPKHIWAIRTRLQHEAVEFATLEWVDWFNHRRLLEPIGNVPPAEAEALDYAQTEDLALAA